MSPRKRILLLILIMSSIVLVVEMITIGLLYKTSIKEQKSHLKQTAKSQARLIESIARFDNVYSQDYPHGTRQATIDQINDAHSKYRGFGKTGEFTLSTRENDKIIFLLSHHEHGLDTPKPVPWDSGLAEPMRLALSGKSGTIIGFDYKGETVLAAYEPMPELNLGIVAKIDLSEIRAPFIKTGALSGFFSLVFIMIGVSLFFKITNPLLKGLHDTVRRLEMALAEVKILKGILPICSYCRKIRDDGDHWHKIEDYVCKQSDIDFSHGICPDCLKDNFPEQYSKMKKK